MDRNTLHAVHKCGMWHDSSSLPPQRTSRSPPTAAMVPQEAAAPVATHSSDHPAGTPMQITGAMGLSIPILLALGTLPVLAPAVSLRVCHNNRLLVCSPTESVFTVGV